ncbi:Shufflon protein [Dirofilaria immitis]
MVATEDERNSKKANDNSQLIVSNYAYDKLDQLAYQQQYFWSWQVILTFLIIILIINALIVLCLMKPESADKMTPISRFVPLNDFRKRTLATFNLRRPLLSIDSNNNLLILSSFENHTDELLVEQLPLDDFQNGFISKNIKLKVGMRNCQQLSSFVYCCVVTTDDNTTFIDKGTHCFRQRYTDISDHFYQKNMQMTHTWQTLSNDNTVVLLRSMAGRYSMLDTKYGTSMPILDNEDYANLTPVASFFGMDNAEELTALVQDDYKFYICEYLRDSKHRFLLQECYETTLVKLDNSTHIKFCANPIYQAIIQLNNAYTNMKWQLQVAYTTTNDIIDTNIYIVDSIDLITDQQMAMICSPFSIDIYMISNNILVHYAIDLPKVDGETLIGNYF